MKMLVTGASGLLGAHVMAAFAPSHEVIGVDRHPWWGDRDAHVLLGDLTDEAFVDRCVAEAAPDVLVHCAAMVNVDACEEAPALAYACNAGVTRRLARAVPRSCLVVYITTDGIFQGDKAFLSEDALPCPRTVYGRAKLHGEWEVQLATKAHLIVRTNFFGWSGGAKPSAAEWLYRALETHQPITLFDDFYFTPLYVVDFVERLRQLIEGGHRGLFHLCGRDRVSKHEFGRMLAEEAGLSMQGVARGAIADAPLRAPRPRDMSLNSERFARATGMDVPCCRSGLARFVGDRDQPLSLRVRS
jgi:dTDP-4-dehydrorhamnose reductase